MQDKYDPNTLWVALNELGEGNIFQVYPRLLAEILLQEEAARQEGDTSEAEKLVLPSDKEWRLQQYFYLVALQKNLEMEQQVFSQASIQCYLVYLFVSNFANGGGHVHEHALTYTNFGLYNITSC